MVRKEFLEKNIFDDVKEKMITMEQPVQKLVTLVNKLFKSLSDAELNNVKKDVASMLISVVNPTGNSMDTFILKDYVFKIENLKLLAGSLPDEGPGGRKVIILECADFCEVAGKACFLRSLPAHAGVIDDDDDSKKHTKAVVENMKLLTKYSDGFVDIVRNMFKVFNIAKIFHDLKPDVMVAKLDEMMVDMKQHMDSWKARQA